MAVKSSKICFFAPGAYPLLTGRDLRNIIGPDIHQILLAKELLKYNFEISFIVYESQSDLIEYIDGIKIIKIDNNLKYNLKILSFIHKILNIFSALYESKAQIYFQHGSGGCAISIYCKIFNKKCIYYIGSDALVDRNLITQKNKEFNESFFSANNLFNIVNIKLADVVVVQNEYQKNLITKFKREGTLIKKHLVLTEREAPNKSNPPVVLWVGSLAEVKRPDIFAMLAEAIPEAIFQMIGGYVHGNKELHDHILEKSKIVPNLKYLGVIAFDEINPYFKNASILVNTSLFEAYPPYAFLQAWMNYVPVVSIGDNSEEIINRYGLGFHSVNIDQMIIDIKTLLNNNELRMKMGQNGRQYVERECDINKIGMLYAEIFNKLTAESA